MQEGAGINRVEVRDTGQQAVFKNKFFLFRIGAVFCERGAVGPVTG
jgi:hypothetical protein